MCAALRVTFWHMVRALLTNRLQRSLSKVFDFAVPA